MSILDLLHIRRTEHKALLQRVVGVLQKDERVVAAWLFGSRGRQTPDELSDTDRPAHTLVSIGTEIADHLAATHGKAHQCRIVEVELRHEPV